MANKQTISSLVTGGEASAGPPLGPALGPMGVNILQIISAINEQTKEFKGMKIPVSVLVDADSLFICHDVSVYFENLILPKLELI